MKNHFVPWGNYPKTLRHEEVIRPMKVLHDFYNAGTVKAHAVLSPDILLPKGFKTSLTKAEQMGLKEVVKVMVERLPSIRLIISLGVHSSPHSYYLLVIFGNEETYEEHQVANMLQEACKSLSSVFIIAHTVTGLKKSDRRRQPFVH